MNTNRTAIALLLSAMFLTGQPLTVAQSGSRDERPVTASPGEPEIRFSIETSSRFGLRTYVPDTWGELYLRLENSGTTSKELLCASYLGQQSTLQYGRQFWVPAGARLHIQHPVLIPKADQFRDQVAEVHSLVFDRTNGNEVSLKNDTGQIRHDQSFLLAPADRNTAIIAGWRTQDAVSQDVLDLIIAGRISQGLRNTVTVLSGQFLPADETSLNYLDHIVVAEDRLLEDSAALAALRRWVHAGGRLWIMLERIDPRLVEQLLGDEFEGSVVGTVDLSSVRIDKAPTLLAPDGDQGEPTDYELPVTLARVVLSGMQVRNTVAGWPAALTTTYGQGRILVTTLGARGWIKPKPPLPHGARDEQPAYLKSPFVPVSPMEDLAGYVFSKRDPEPMQQSDLESLTQEFVAYKIPSWTMVVGTLCGFLILLTSIGLWFWRTGKLEHFGWVGALLAALFGGLFVGIGISIRYAVPETMASVQLAQVIDGSDDVRTQGAIAVYRREGDLSPVHTTHGGKLQRDMAGLEGTTCRMVTTDLGTFRWEGLPQPAGLQMYADAASTSLRDRISAEVTVNSDGLVGKLTGLDADTTDAVLATQQGRIAVTLKNNGDFAAPASDVMGPDQYLNAAFVGDVQHRRRRILRQLFDNHTWADSLTQPHVFVWSGDWDSGFQFGEGLQRQGETLLMLPVDLRRPKAGTELVIPSPLIRYASCMAPNGSLPTGFWDDLRREWQERSSLSTTWLKIQVPRSLLPLQVTKARIDVKVTGAMGQLEFLGARDAAEVPLQSVRNPVGSLTFEIDDPAVLAVSMNGDFSLGVKAGMPDNSVPEANADPLAVTAKSYWRIESLAVQLWAVTTELSAED